MVRSSWPAKSINRSSYRQADAQSFRATIVTLQCLLKQRHAYKYAVTGQWNPQTLRGLNAFQRVSGRWSRTSGSAWAMPAR